MITEELSRLERRSDPERVPSPVGGEAGLFIVDATWGMIQPISLAPGVRKVGELEVIEHLKAGRLLVDCRLPELDQFEPVVLFCNGPQCTDTAQATAALLAAGWPAERLLYSRGGVHDWVTLGLPLAELAS